ncbi:MAG: PEP-CTERM sorting domain-containing protein [Chthonomonas sp.]|nr:PEP-CTERM sorting domain-containing protein [Chthonomonas sp.]
MKNWLVTVAVVLLAPVTAHASFDLMLVSSANAEPSSFSNRIHRLDPVTGAYLGSFLVPTKPAGMAASRQRGELYVLGINGDLRVYNYSTGERKAIYNLGIGGVLDLAISNDESKLYVVNGSSQVWTTSALTPNSLSSVGSRAGANYRTVSISPSGSLFATDSLGSRLDRFLPSGGSFAFSSFGTIASGSATMSQVAISGPSPTGFAVLGPGPSAASGQFMNLSSDNPSGFTSFAFTTFGFSDYRSAVRAHDGAYFIGTDSSGANTVRVGSLDGLAYYGSSYAFSGVSGGAGKVAIVLAPEPASLLPVALGALLILRRRKRSR